MATGIDVFFTGLMLICLDGQPNCPARTGWNTAWVVKADGPRRVCGVDSLVETELELRFNGADFTYHASGEVECKPEVEGSSTIRCNNFTEGRICLETDSLRENQFPDRGLEQLPRLDELDRRFKFVLRERLRGPYVPSSIDFPKGLISAGAKWPSDIRPRLWYRSDRDAGGALPRELSDRLRVTYPEATTITLTTCGPEEPAPLLYLTRRVPNAQVTFRNRGNPLPFDSRGGFDNLTYLLWYYLLGSWATGSGNCPEYAPERPNTAIVLSCVRERDRERDANCACYDACDADTTFWPPVVKPY